MARRKRRNVPRRNQNQDLIKAVDRTLQETHSDQAVVTKEKNGYVISSIQELREERYYSGPLPSPQILKEYDELLPGTAENFINDYRKVLNKNIENNDKIINAEVFSKKLGSITSAVFVLGSLGATILFGILGLPVPATVSSLTTLGGLYFAYLKKDDKK